MSQDRLRLLLYPMMLGLVLGLGFFVGLGLLAGDDSSATAAAVAPIPTSDSAAPNAPTSSEDAAALGNDDPIHAAAADEKPDEDTPTAESTFTPAIGHGQLTESPMDRSRDPGGLSDHELETIALFERLSPSVVFVTSIAQRRDFFSMRVGEYESGRGSGFIWNTDGHIVTNYHVIQNATAGLRVTLADQTVLDADIVGIAPEKDLAVLRVYHDPDALHPLPLGRSDNLLVGQSVLAIGNPFGLDQTLTTGIISALGRTIEGADNDSDIRDVIQTDAAINPGNSGGPLIDSSGRLIGVNTAIASPSGAYAGVGFAIPVDTVRWVVPDLIEHGRVQRPSLGFTHWPISINRRFDYAGAMVQTIAENGPAETAGLRGTFRNERGNVVFGDIVTAIDGQPVGTPGDLLRILEGYEIGDTVEITYVRDRRTFQTTIELVAE